MHDILQAPSDPACPGWAEAAAQAQRPPLGGTRHTLGHSGRSKDGPVWPGQSRPPDSSKTTRGCDEGLEAWWPSCTWKCRALC